jgi:hypothetical protein
MHLLSVHFSVSLMYFRVSKQSFFSSLSSRNWRTVGPIVIKFRIGMSLRKFVGYGFPTVCLQPDIII